MSKENFMRKIRVNVNKRSAFDKSFKNLFTLPIGTLVPLLCDEVVPNTNVNLEVALSACLPPLATKTFMNVDVKLEAFFVPNRVLYGGYQAWLTGEKLYDPATLVRDWINVIIPRLYISSSHALAWLNPGSLADYLGYKLTNTEVTYLDSASPAGGTYFNIFPFLAYHRVYDDWYRNTMIQNPVFCRPVANTGQNNTVLSNVPYVFKGTGNFTFNLLDTFYDGVHLGDLRKRNFGIDYFTNGTTRAQSGNPSQISIDTSGSSTNLSISSIRVANSLQQYLERNNYCGFVFQDYVKGHYGADLSDGVAQRTMYLGSGSMPVYSKGVQQAFNDLGGSPSTNNPFKTVASEYGSAQCDGRVKLISGFNAEEPGYILVMVSVVPKVTYSSGILRQNLRYATNNSQVDLATPLLQNTGQQPIFSEELCPHDGIMTPLQNVFAYTDKYADFMVREDELHGLVRDDSSLEAFALQRSFNTGGLQINSSFLEIPDTYLDQVAAASAGISGYGAWIDSYLNYRISMPLAQFSIPSLQDPAYEHGHSVTLRRGGSRID